MRSNSSSGLLPAGITSKVVSLADVRENPTINTLIEKSNEHLSAIGLTDHGLLHIRLVSRLAQKVLLDLGYDERTAELAGIAGYMHDIGNVVNRHGHSQSGALIAMYVLRKMGMDEGEAALISSAIGNHDEGSGMPVNHIAAALILADKTHVHRNRVRYLNGHAVGIHERVNYAVTKVGLDVDGEHRRVVMRLSIDTSFCQVMEYFEIFLSRMLLCRKAAEYLGCEFWLYINEQRLV